MASNICSNLLMEAWKGYNPALAPEGGGIYCIGEWNGSGYDVIYVGRTNNIRRRLGEHMSGNVQDIDKYINGKIASLAIKWILDPGNKCNEGEYLTCIAGKLGYRPKYNMQRGNSCS
jgi:hypothetical protein